MIPGYHAGELWLHEPARAIERLAKIGYRSVAIRPRQGVCVAGDSGFDGQWREICEAATQAGVRLVIDTEAAFVVDPNSGSLPSLASDDDSYADLTVTWIEQWIEVVGRLQASGQGPGEETILSIASGHVENASENEKASENVADESLLERVARRFEKLARKASEAGVVLAVRPAVGHAIASVAQFERLRQWLQADVSLGLAADIGEMLHAGEMPLVARLQRQSDHLKLVYLCDTGSTYPGLDSTGPGLEPTEQEVDPMLPIGRMDVPLGTGELAVDRIVGELAKFTDKMPIIVRVAGHAGAGLVTAQSAMDCLHPVSAWRNACRE